MRKLPSAMKTSLPRIEDIARRAGVSKCTVSYALRNHPRASVATQKRIQTIAHEMGYRANPITSLMMNRVRSAIPGRLQAKIAYLVNYRNDDYHSRSTYQRLEQGIKSQADRIGFGIEIFNLESQGISYRRFQQILRTRNIQGLILSPLSEESLGRNFDIDWSQFATAALGFSFASLPVHRAANFQYHSIRAVYARLKSLGYDRIALAIDPRSNQKYDHHWRSAFLDSKEMDSQELDPASCFALGEAIDGSSFLQWVEVYRPDALITDREECINLLSNANIWIPQEIAVAFAKLRDPITGYAGIDQQEEKIGAAAVDLVVEQLSQNQTGLPGTPKTVLIEGEWRDGWTVSSPTQN